ncbi:hypothetical protein EDD36DRAFT_446002 [Exophiala viscosa]|uniref:Uncharacterized protein n=1 Tax=Exophiala viscosa TaxID=2486360 RepID=A0AAN6DQG3_9EURO|nr:hypothetical protein EDD36DRAFT_446002 [Exophiala viscosa]
MHFSRRLFLLPRSSHLSLLFALYTTNHFFIPSPQANCKMPMNDQSVRTALGYTAEEWEEILMTEWVPLVLELDPNAPSDPPEARAYVGPSELMPCC